MRVSVDGRALDTEHMRAQGIGRYAHGLLSALGPVAGERGGELVVLRRSGGEGSPFGDVPGRARAVRRPPLPARAVELADQALLPLDLARTRADVHHALSLYGAPLATRTPLVVTMHDVIPLQHPELYLKTGLAHRALYRAARRAAAVVCPSRAAAGDIERHLGVQHVAVVPEAADEHFRPVDATGVRGRLGLTGPYLLYVGGMARPDPRKDLEGLVEAFAGWSRSEERPETLVLAGSPGPEARSLAERVPGVKLAGFVPDEDLPGLLSGASCFVTASRYEGFGLPALESIACGTPVVAYDAGAIPETAGPGAFLVAPGDAAALMRAAGRVCDQAETAARLSREGLEHAAGYSWRRTAEETWAVYEGVASMPRP